MLGVREERWKYILNVRDGTEELFDLTRRSRRAAERRRAPSRYLRPPQAPSRRVDRGQSPAVPARQARRLGALAGSGTSCARRIDHDTETGHVECRAWEYSRQGRIRIAGAIARECPAIGNCRLCGYSFDGHLGHFPRGDRL